jgi:hypothetical protein
MHSRFTLEITTSVAHHDLKKFTDRAAEALRARGLIADGDYVENPKCGSLDWEHDPRGIYRAKVAPDAR